MVPTFSNNFKGVTAYRCSRWCTGARLRLLYAGNKDSKSDKGSEEHKKTEIARTTKQPMPSTKSEHKARPHKSMCFAAEVTFFSMLQEALSWGGSLEEELRRAATTLDLSEIVQRYHVTGFNLVDAPRATRLLRSGNPRSCIFVVKC